MSEAVSSQLNSNPSPLDLVQFLPYACNQLNAPFCVKVIQEIQDVYVSKVDKGDDKSRRLGKVKSIVQTSYTQKTSEEDVSVTGQTASYDGNLVVIKAVFDVSGYVTAFVFEKCKKVPRLLLKIIALCVPYHHYLNKISIRRVVFPGECLYELANSLKLSHITEVNLEDLKVPQGNYCLLLENAQLKCLSICWCRLNDDVCVEIASKLIHPLPASRSLMVLSLRNNVISDVGALALGHALRSNRTLQYLNLSGNQITDVGASAIFESLTEFFLTYEELITKRQRLFDYIKLRQETYEKCLVDIKKSFLEKSLDEFSRSSKRRATTMKSKSTGPSAFDILQTKAEMMTKEIVGEHMDPFTRNDTIQKDQYVYSIGNLTLCYLNLSYNNLGYPSVVKLENLLKYQSTVSRPDKNGLIRVVIEGNDIPIICEEYGIIEEYLERVIYSRIAKPSKKLDQKKSRTK